MKKLLSIIFALSVLTAGIFAQDIATDFANVAKDAALDGAKFAADKAVDATAQALEQIPDGTWIDSNWNAHWVMDMGKVILKDSVTGEVIYTFTKENTKDFKLTPSKEDITLSFYCAETERAYKIRKPYTLSSDLELFIEPDWTDEDYNVTIKYVKK